jgi:peptidoglycan lytic transglycosylase D
MKQKLTRKGVVANGFLFLFALLSMAATRQASFTKTAGTDTTFLSLDTSLLRLNGASETDLLNAPVISMNKHAVSFVSKYIASNKEDLDLIRQKSAAYFKITDDVFNSYGLPQELKYLAVIESELNTKALSHVGARGAWQLMPETARILSLKITRKYDERTHFYKSTVAAAKYLRDLHAQFNDWLLVIASYNSGPGKVLDAIKKSGSRNFWKMQNYLPAETRGHVKRFIATHYYFEGKGSITTLTREEAITYRKKMQAYVEAQNNLAKERHNEMATEIATNKNIESSESKTIAKAQLTAEAKGSKE